MPNSVGTPYRRGPLSLLCRTPSSSRWSCSRASRLEHQTTVSLAEPSGRRWWRSYLCGVRRCATFSLVRARNTSSRTRSLRKRTMMARVRGRPSLSARRPRRWLRSRSSISSGGVISSSVLTISNTLASVSSPWRSPVYLRTEDSAVGYIVRASRSHQPGRALPSPGWRSLCLFPGRDATAFRQLWWARLCARTTPPGRGPFSGHSVPADRWADQWRATPKPRVLLLCRRTTKLSSASAPLFSWGDTVSWGCKSRRASMIVHVFSICLSA